MKITIAKPDFNKDFLQSVEEAKQNNVLVDLVRNESKGVVKVRARVKTKSGDVTLANMMLKKDKDSLVVTSKRVIDEDFKPLNIMLSELVSFYEKSDIKYIILE